MIILYYKDRRPLYEQVVDKISELIIKGALQKDAQLPSVRNLAMDLSINPNTIQRAYATLERLGYIYSIKGRGNFVADKSGYIDARKEDVIGCFTKHVEEAYELGIESKELHERIYIVYGREKKDD